ncbi:MAG: RNA polymerase sigma factor [Actinomycetota bacterium]|nr:RNA polymerase sigma factor [Actinomycetota bacterium]
MSDRAGLLDVYDASVGDVYGYLLRRCRHQADAEDLTSEVFLAAAAAERDRDAEITIAWLIGVARHKLVDHWRRIEREHRREEAVVNDTIDADDDPWDRTLDAMIARDVLGRLGEPHRSALTLRYVDGLTVPTVAGVLDRTIHATEAVLVRARRAFRIAYEEVTS